MKWDTLKQRIKQAKESDIEHLLPYDDFIHKVESAQVLVDFVERRQGPQNALIEVYKHMVIMCVSAMESYFQGMAEIFINDIEFKDSFLDILRQEKVSLAELVEINKEKITLAEIIAASQSFQSLRTVNNFYSKLLNVKDFIREVSEYKVSLLQNNDVMILAVNHPEFRKDIDELLHARHLIIHHKYTKKTISEIRLMDIVGSLMDFIVSVDLYLLNMRTDIK